jgi:sec-independent protein translocase protein TatC
MAAPLQAPDDERMSLFEHLAELRARLLRVTWAVLVLGGISLAYAKPLFGLLMRPVLDALPASGRALVFTSGIEEINVLMKVGMYAGIFLTTPVILWQLWSFVSPGLYAEERRMAAPFVVVGTLAFVAGAAFCYLVVLPPMFQFLLREGDSAALEQRLSRARREEADALRLLGMGELGAASERAKAARKRLSATGEGQGAAGSLAASEALEVEAKLDGLGRLLDAARLGLPVSAKPVLRAVVDARGEAVEAHARGDVKAAAAAVDRGAAQLAGTVPQEASQWAELWRLEEALAVGAARYEALNWTRPMLTMREQLSLVLLMELSFGIIFELPLVMALLGLVGFLKFDFLMRYQRHAFVFCLIAAAIITPTGDAINLALMAGPMLMCFELGVLAVWITERRRKAQVEPGAAA